jgi:hypothetical protein
VRRGKGRDDEIHRRRRSVLRRHTANATQAADSDEANTYYIPDPLMEIQMRFLSPIAGKPRSLVLGGPNRQKTVSRILIE